VKLFCTLITAATIGLAAAQVFAEEAAPATTTPAVQQVDSSLIKSVSYDPATSVLTVVMAEGNETYEYKGVPESVYKELMTAESKGTYFVKNIKGKFEFTKK
jgi:hypothetical protein